MRLALVASLTFGVCALAPGLARGQTCSRTVVRAATAGTLASNEDADVTYVSKTNPAVAVVLTFGPGERIPPTIKVAKGDFTLTAGRVFKSVCAGPPTTATAMPTPPPPASPGCVTSTTVLPPYTGREGTWLSGPMQLTGFICHGACALWTGSNHAQGKDAVQVTTGAIPSGVDLVNRGPGTATVTVCAQAPVQ